MKDTEILRTIHRWMNQSIQRDEDEPTQARRMIDCRNFIEQEWQREDDQELVDQYNRNREPKDHIIDVAEIERHRGLVIGEDGTVTDLK
tara:strand:+ start:225 stop:491 length:267 start_codon:yes stop_codon:yes gene_type:complete